MQHLSCERIEESTKKKHQHKKYKVCLVHKFNDIPPELNQEELETTDICNNLSTAGSQTQQIDARESEIRNSV